MATVTKRDLVMDVSDSTGLTQSEVKTIVDEFLSTVGDILSEENSIEIRGFGSFYPKMRKPRPARNIHTGEVVPLQLRAVPLFRYSGGFKKLINSALKGESNVGKIFYPVQ